MLPPSDPAHTARVRIFMMSGEAPFAGHPNIGTATVLAWRGELFGKPIGDTMVFEEIAGLVGITVTRDGEGRPNGAQLVAPAQFAKGAEVAPADVATALGLDVAQIETKHHTPVVGSVGLPFVLAELTDRAALEQASGHPSPVWETLQQLELGGTPSAGVHAYIRAEDGDSVDIRARMLEVGLEDPATG